MISWYYLFFKSLKDFRLLFLSNIWVYFCKLNYDRFIFVNFKAWEYVGSDTLWAGIITNLSDVIEAHFGVVLCRLFRTVFPLATCQKDPAQKNPDEKENKKQENGSDTGNSLKSEEKEEKSRDNFQRSFCAHHRRYPKTSCKLPVLYWWVLLLTTAVMVPVMTYVVATMLNRRVMMVCVPSLLLIFFYKIIVSIHKWLVACWIFK